MAVKFQDYYEKLGVARSSTPEEIKLALGDPEKRRRYDELGPNWQDGSSGPTNTGGTHRHRTHSAQGETDFEFSGTGFSDFFESFFGGGRDGFGSRHPSAGRAGGNEPFVQQGQDIEADLLVTLEEALRGSLRKVTLRRPGTNGAEDRTNTYQVRIPAGVREGQRIRLAGQGGTGVGGGTSGDLYLRVRLARHPDFSVQAADLYFDLNLAPWEAVLGVQAKIPTLDGQTSLRVPAGTAARSQLRLRGLGLPREDKTRGDIYATVRIQTPVVVTAEERVLWEQLSRLSSFKPRSES
jgi:curved DNA-binding protein